MNEYKQHGKNKNRETDKRLLSSSVISSWMPEYISSDVCGSLTIFYFWLRLIRKRRDD
jgi:hypothetical protein